MPNNQPHLPFGSPCPHLDSGIPRMCIPVRILLVFPWLFLLSVSHSSGAEAGVWKAGMAQEKITPEQPVWMAGYAARNGPSDGVLTDLYVRALALTDGRGYRLVIVGLDLIEIPQTMRDRIVAMAAKSHGLKLEELLVSTSHTHGGPMVSSKTVADWGIDPVWGKRADEYVEFLIRKMDAVIGKAIAAQAPATLVYAASRCGHSMNRRLPTPMGFRLAPNPNGPVDPEVPILRIETPAGKLAGVVFGFACHNTALGPTRKINGDYAGFAQRKLEKDHPGAIALFLAGCGGDQNPSPNRGDGDAEPNGLALAAAVEAGLAGKAIPLEAGLSVSMEVCPLPFAPLPDRADLEARAKSGNSFVARHARWVLKEWPNPGDRPPDYPLPVQVVDFGGKLTLVALGGEPVVDYALRLKGELRSEGKPVWVAGYSNLVHAYVPTRRVLLEGGYEGTEAVIYQSLPGPFAVEVEDRIVESVHRQVHGLRSKRPGN